MNDENKDLEVGGVADMFVTEGGDSGDRDYIKGVDFDGEGLTLEVVGMSKFTPTVGADGTNYGAKNTYGAGGVMTKENWFVKQGLLEEGDSFKYTFKEGETEKSFDNSSVGFYFAFIKVNPKAGEKVFIQRLKNSNTDIKWTINIV